MRPRDGAAEAARAEGRQNATYEVVVRPLVRNNRTLKPGARIRLSKADAEILVGRGRIKPAKGKPGAAAEGEAGE